MSGQQEEQQPDRAFTGKQSCACNTSGDCNTSGNCLTIALADSGEKHEGRKQPGLKPPTEYFSDEAGNKTSGVVASSGLGEEELVPQRDRGNHAGKQCTLFPCIFLPVSSSQPHLMTPHSKLLCSEEDN
jgi:hypothetical protein